jgi:hypothetical protein
MDAMNSAARIHDHAAELLRRVQAFHEAVARPGESGAAATALGRLEEAVHTLSSSWAEIAAEGAPDPAERRRLATPASPLSPQRRLGPFPRFERHERPTGRAA